jgi:hypothetical protein
MYDDMKRHGESWNTKEAKSDRVYWIARIRMKLNEFVSEQIELEKPGIEENAQAEFKLSKEFIYDLKTAISLIDTDVKTAKVYFDRALRQHPTNSSLMYF